MSKTIVIKIKKAGNRLNSFSIKDDQGNVLFAEVTKAQLIMGIPAVIGDTVSVITLIALDNDCCGTSWNIPISQLTLAEVSAIQYEPENTSSLWRHLTDPTLYNNFYGCIQPYILEYPFSYQYNDEILQNVKDYTKVYKYLPTDDGVFNYNRKIQTDNDYFNKAIVYNDQQSSGVLELVAKPINNLSAYMKYPIYNSDSKTILFAKRDNFYQFNTFWNTLVDKTQPLFVNSCVSLSLDKEVNQSNMDYSVRSFKKQPIRAKDSKLRLILDNTSSVHLVSQLMSEGSQISYL